jgi:hypothetical protein
MTIIECRYGVEAGDVRTGTKLGFSGNKFSTGTGWSQVWYTVTSAHATVTNPDFFADGREPASYLIDVELVADRTGREWRGVLYLYRGKLDGNIYKLNKWRERSARRTQEYIKVSNTNTD